MSSQINNTEPVSPNSRSPLGIVSGILAFLWWGFFPLYWNLIRHVSAFEVLAHRICWSLVFVLVIVVATRQHRAFLGVLADWRRVRFAFLSAVAISINWGLYLWAVTHGYILQSSLGYFINPLLSVLLGVVLLGEKLSKAQIIAITLAGAGCLSMLLFVGEFPWLALILSSTFAAYGFMRKISALGSVQGLALETLLLTPVALGYLWYCDSQGILSFGTGSTSTDFVLAGAGIITAAPLLLFAEAARRIPLSTLGLLQYLSPSCQFFLAIFVFGEKFTFSHFLSFGLIWAGLIAFTVDLAKRS